MIDHAPVQSSSIRSIGYSPESRELHVNFHDTGTYVYHGVTPEKYEALMMASSKGSFLHHNIKGQHEHKKHD
jgi:hypothetical protein